jgi:hypothetical protein
LALTLFDRRTRAAWLGGTLVLVVALFTKQTAIDAALACLGFAALTRPRLALHAALTVLGLGLVGLGALQLMTGGAFWLNVVAGNANPFDLGQLFGYLRNFVEVHPVLLALAVVEATLAIRARNWSPWALYLPFAAAMSLTVGKWGAGESYFLPLIAACCVLGASRLVCIADAAASGMAAHRSLEARGLTSLRLARLAAIGLFLQLLLFSHWPLTDLPGLPDRGFQGALLGFPPSQSDHDSGARIAALLRAAEGPVLAEDTGFALTADKPVIGNPTHLRNLHQAGQWDPTQLVSMIQARAFDMIVLNAQLYPVPVLEAIGRAYYVDQSVDIHGAKYLIFLPGGDPAR